MEETLAEIGREAAALTAVFGLFALLSKAPPVRWLIRRLIAEPITAWAQSQVHVVVDERFTEIDEQLRPNEGKSLRDRVDTISEQVESLMPPESTQGRPTERS